MAAVVLLCAASCHVPRSSRLDDRTPPPPLTYDAIMAPAPTRAVHRELARLEAARHSPSAQLRAASILLASRQHERALSKLNSLLYGSVEHGPSVESFARFLRAAAFEQRGERDRAERERDLARAAVVDPKLRAALKPAVPVAKAEGLPAADASIRPRSAWQAQPATEMVPMSKIRRITIHHSATIPRGNSMPITIAAIRSIQRHHQVDRGWSDIGYHYLIDPAGRIWEGRKARWQGAHAGDFEKNRGNLGICLLGNFLRRQQQPSKAQVIALETLTKTLLARHGLGRQAIRTHTELKNTPCPGENLQAVVDRIRGFSVAAAASR